MKGILNCVPVGAAYDDRVLTSGQEGGVGHVIQTQQLNSLHEVVKVSMRILAISNKLQ